MTPSRHNNLQPGRPESIGALLARVRLASGRSQLRLAELLCAASGIPTVTRHEISRWEREERIPSGHWLRWLAAVLDVPLTDLERAAALARADGPSGGVPPDRARPRAPTGIGWLRRMDDLVGGPDLLGVVDGELTRMLAALRTAGSPRHRRLLPVVAELAQLTGWVAADAGEPARAWRAHRLGLRMAAQAGAAPLVGHLLGTLAHLGTAHDPPAALALARQGHAVAGPTASARTRALLLHRVAFAAARAGERRECERALAAADRAAGSGGDTGPTADPPWLYWLDEIELTALTGRCFAALGRPGLAEPLLRTALDSGRIGLRSWALYAVWLAHAHLDAGEVEPACALADEALLTTVRVGSVRARRQLAALHPRLRRLRGEPAVRAYAERLHDVRRYLPGGGTDAARAG